MLGKKSLVTSTTMDQKKNQACIIATISLSSGKIFVTYVNYLKLE